MRPTNCANNSAEAGIAYVNGYSDPPPTIIETAFSVPINVPSPLPLSAILHLRRPSRSRPPSSSSRCTIAPLFSSFPLRVLTGESMIWKSSDDQVGRWSCPRDIWVTRSAGASYKLNLRNYGSNYVGIRAITGASTAPAYLGRLTLISRFVMKMKATISLSSRRYVIIAKFSQSYLL